MGLSRNKERVGNYSNSLKITIVGSNILNRCGCHLASAAESLHLGTVEF